MQRNQPQGWPPHVRHFVHIATITGAVIPMLGVKV